MNLFSPEHQSRFIKANPNMYNLNASKIMFAQRREERRTKLLFQLCLRLQTFILFLVSLGLKRERSDEPVLSNIRCIIHFNSENKYLPFLTSGGERESERERRTCRLRAVVWSRTSRGEIFASTQEQPTMKGILCTSSREISPCAWLRLSSLAFLPPRSNHAPS